MQTCKIRASVQISISCARNDVRPLRADRGIVANVMLRHIPVKMKSFCSTHANRATG